MIACVSHASETFSVMFLLSSSSIGFVPRWSLYSSSYHQEKRARHYMHSHLSAQIFFIFKKRGVKLSHYSILFSYFGGKKSLTLKGRILIIKYVCGTLPVTILGGKNTLHGVVPAIFLPLILILF